MKEKTEATTAVAATANEQLSQPDCPAKLNNLNGKTKDLVRVLQFFRYKVGTSLDCAIETGILRNSITWYVLDLEKLKMLQAIRKAKDATTGFLAKHYSANPSLWRKPMWMQGELFTEEGGMAYDR